MGGRILGLAALAALVFPATAAAVPPCPNAQTPRVLLSGQGVLESVIADEDGTLFYTDGTKKALMRLDAGDTAPRVLVAGVEGPGGLTWSPDGTRLILGFGTTIPGGAMGGVTALLDQPGPTGLLEIDPDTGARETFATGLGQSNGLATGPDGAVYASNDVSTHIERVKDGHVDRRWAAVLSANGLAIDPTGRWLYANQTFVPAAIARVDLANPSRVETYARPGLIDIAAGLDGMTIDPAGRLYSTANGGNQVWRIGTNRSICSLAGGVLQPSAAAIGRGAGRPTDSIYVVTFRGQLLELPGAVPG